MAKIYVIQEIEGRNKDQLLEKLLANGIAWRCGNSICVNEEGAKKLLDLYNNGDIQFLVLAEAATA